MTQPKLVYHRADRQAIRRHLDMIETVHLPGIESCELEDLRWSLGALRIEVVMLGQAIEDLGDES